jgi:starvation-inducible DNA-binding protein
MTNKTTGKAIAKEKPLSQEAVAEISDALRQLLADVFCLCLKTKSFHWHITGRHFHDYHVLLDEHAQQVFAMGDDIAERARKIGGTTVRSVGDISRRQRLKDNDAESLTAHDRLSELRDDNLILSGFLRHAHETCAKFYDVATTSLIEVWIDQAERRTWFLTEITSEP